MFSCACVCVCARAPANIYAKPCFNEVLFVYRNMTCGLLANESCHFKEKV